MTGPSGSQHEDDTRPGEVRDQDTVLAGRRALARLAPCVVPALAAGDRVAPVRLDGVRATLVVRAPVAGAREAQVYSCGDGDALLASTSLPVG